MYIGIGTSILGGAVQLAEQEPFRIPVKQPFNSLSKTGLTVAIGTMEEHEIGIEIDLVNGGAEPAEVTDR